MAVLVGVAVRVGVADVVGALLGASVPIWVTVAVFVAVKLGMDIFVGVNNTNVPVDVGEEVDRVVGGICVGTVVFVGVTGTGIRLGMDWPGVRKILIQTGGVRMAGSSGARL